MNNDSNSLLSLANDTTNAELLASGLKCVEYNAGYSKLYYASQENKYKDWLVVVGRHSFVFPEKAMFKNGKTDQSPLPHWMCYS